jgi:mannosyl-3-phosphoglycerate phosphatase
MQDLVIYSDLDGTLIDFEDYSFEVTAPLVRTLESKGVPVVFCSSKTRLEQAFYRKAIGVKAPFITENGSAVFIPKNYFSFEFTYDTTIGDYLVIELGTDRKTILAEIADARSKSGAEIYGYADLDINEISAILKLDLDASQRAATRDYSETLIKGDKKSPTFKQMISLLEQKGLQCNAGGKFHTVISQKSDKGKAVQTLHALFKQQNPQAISVGLGDSANDLPMLQAVNKPFLVQKPGNWWDNLSAPNLTKVPAVGPKGWVKAVEGLFSSLP